MFHAFSPLVVAVDAGAIDKETAVWSAQAVMLSDKIAPNASTLDRVRNFRLSMRNSLLRNSRKENFLKNCHRNLSSVGSIHGPKVDIVHCCPCCMHPLHSDLLQMKQRGQPAKKSFLLYHPSLCTEKTTVPEAVQKNFLNLLKIMSII